ncbi:Hsp33 family molecular chaperone HslO [Amphibiibacter pelophylacis]|uniref:Hsp33 family molecular chaperone HslO n=1 Tax=Amphibiibacter pelophylacis TaxID=1799477 RepID=A0ACC6P246_9BURK
MTPMTSDSGDVLQSFLFDGLPVRGLLVRLGGSWRELLRRRQTLAPLPDAVRDTLGELAAAAVLMQANLKFEGALELQIQGDAALKLLVAEARHDLGFRATCKWTGPQHSQHPPEAHGNPDLARLVNTRGLGRCAITLDPGRARPGQQAWQGIVALNDASGQPLHRLSDALEHYMQQSEQLHTRFVLAADGETAAGILIQRLPLEGENNLGGERDSATRAAHDDAVERISHLVATVQREELLTLPAPELLRRLFWEDTLLDMGQRTPHYGCTCTRERVGGMLRHLGHDDVQALLAERGGHAEIACEFCGEHYRYDAVDVAHLFTPDPQGAPGPSGVQ